MVPNLKFRKLGLSGLTGQNSGEATLEPRFAWHKLWLLNIGPFGKYLPRRYWTLQQFKEKTWELSYLRCHLCSSQIWRSRIPPLKKQTNNWTPIPYYKYSILWIILSDLCFVSKFFFPHWRLIWYIYNWDKDCYHSKLIWFECKKTDMMLKCALLCYLTYMVSTRHF